MVQYSIGDTMPHWIFYARANDRMFFSSTPPFQPLNNDPEQRKRAFFHRGSHADQSVIQSILHEQCYAFEHLRRAGDIQKAYQTMLQHGQVPLILDAGAHIGASVVYWAKHYPQAHITAWEPDAANFEILTLNTRGLNVDLRLAALGATSGEMTLVDPGEGEWGYRIQAEGVGPRVVVESASTMVAAKRAGGYCPFIAKIDIEGGEAELFAQDTDWVDFFPLLIIELHDWLLPGRANSQNFLRCVASKKRDFVFRGENVFSIANP